MVLVFKEQVDFFLEFGLAPPSHLAEGFLAVFGSHGVCHGVGRCDFYCVNDGGA